MRHAARVLPVVPLERELGGGKVGRIAGRVEGRELGVDHARRASSGCCSKRARRPPRAYHPSLPIGTKMPFSIVTLS